MTDFDDSLRLTKTIANAKYWENQIKRLQIIKWLVGLLVRVVKLPVIYVGGNVTGIVPATRWVRAGNDAVMTRTQVSWQLDDSVYWTWTFIFSPRSKTRVDYSKHTHH